MKNINNKKTTITITYPEGSGEFYLNDKFVEEKRMDVIALLFERAMKEFCNNRGLDSSQVLIKSKKSSYFEEGKWRTYQ